MQRQFSKYCFNVISLLIFLALSSCAEALDFDQGDEVVLGNELEVDLVFFTLDTSNFLNLQTNTLENTEVNEETQLEFLDDDFIQRNLKELDLALQFDNSFQQAFIVQIAFSDKSGREVHVIDLVVEASADASPVRTVYEEKFVGSKLDDIKSAITMEVMATLDENGDRIIGALVFQSKVRYRFEF